VKNLLFFVPLTLGMFGCPNGSVVVAPVGEVIVVTEDETIVQGTKPNSQITITHEVVNEPDSVPAIEKLMQSVAKGGL